MESIMNLLTEEPLYGLIAGIVILLLVVSVLKKVLVFALLAAAILAGVTVYLQVANETPVETAERRQSQKALTDQLTETTRAATKKVGEELMQTGDALTEHLKGDVRVRVERTLDNARMGAADALEVAGDKTQETTEKLGETIHSAGESLNKNIKKQAAKLKKVAAEVGAEAAEAVE